MMKCNSNLCHEEGHLPQAGFCGECWGRLPASTQRGIIEARSRGAREEAEAIQAAKALLRKAPI